MVTRNALAVSFAAAYGQVCPRDRSLPGCVLHDTEAVAVGIFQHYKVLLRTISPRIPRRPELEQPLHVSLLVVGVEIQVHSARLADGPERFWNLLQRDVGSPVLGITKNHPSFFSGLSGNVVEGFLPE